MGSPMRERFDFEVINTFAEAFPMTAARAIVTADTPGWAEIAGRTMTGYATSVIGCDAEAAIERALGPDETPDGRPGVSVLLFAFSRDALEKALMNRVGQCVMTCPTPPVNGLRWGQDVNVGGSSVASAMAGRSRSARRALWRSRDGRVTCEELWNHKGRRAVTSSCSGRTARVRSRPRNPQWGRCGGSPT